MTDQEKWRKLHQLKQERAEIVTDCLRLTGRMKAWVIEAERFLRESKSEERALYRQLKV